MRRIYSSLGLLWMLLLATAGTLALKRPIAATRGDAAALWLAWAIIVAGSWISLHGNMYSSYLQGVNQIALLRRWETLISLGVMATSFLILVAGGGLLGLVFANQGWQIVCILGNRWLARNAENGLLRSFVKAPFARDVFAAVWPSAWRSGIGILMSYGLIQVSGIAYAQIGETAKVAMYLLGLRLIQTVSQFSQAPFYSKLPLLARLFSAGRLDELLRMAKRGMTFSHWIFTAGFIGLGVAGAPLCRHIGSNAAFPDQLLWSLMGLGFFIERYGAMHIQLYSTTNRIIWHIANGVMGILFILISLALFPPLGIYAFPVGIIAGYLGFYSWFAALHSYRTFKMNFLAFEMRTSILPLLTIVLYIALSGLASRLFGLAF
jgi:O-antigen/teichoic acid export membrane protein